MPQTFNQKSATINTPVRLSACPLVRLSAYPPNKTKLK